MAASIPAFLIYSAQHLCSRIIDAGDCARIHHQPVQRRRCSFDETTHIGCEVAGIGIEEVCPESKTHQVRPAQHARDGRYRPPLPTVNQHGRMRSIAVAHVPEQRQQYREQDALLDADHHNHRSD